MFVLPRRHYKTEGFRLILRAWLSEFVLKIVAICTHVTIYKSMEVCMLVFLDTETTGLDVHSGQELLSIAVITEWPD